MGVRVATNVSVSLFLIKLLPGRHAKPRVVTVGRYRLDRFGALATDSRRGEVRAPSPERARSMAAPRAARVRRKGVLRDGAGTSSRSRVRRRGERRGSHSG